VDLEIPIPDWVDVGARPITGLDLLSLRLPVQRIGTSVLSGVTTISPTVRYLSLRSWILQLFQKSGLPAARAALVEFAAPIEAAVVLGNLLLDPQAIGLIGSNEANELLKQVGDPVDLGRLAKILAFNVYAGPSDELGVSVDSDAELPGITKERGIPLAESIESFIAQTSYWRQFSDGKPPARMTRAQLKELGGALPMREIPASERQLLISIIVPIAPKILRQRDEGSRVATYARLLALAREHGRVPTEDDFFASVIRVEEMNLPYVQDVLDGWACYLVRDVLAVVHEAALAAIIEAIGASYSVAVYTEGTEVVESLLQQVEALSEPLRSLKLLGMSETLQDVTLAELDARVANQLNVPQQITGITRWSGALNELQIMRLAENADVGALALLPVAWLLIRKRVAADGASQTSLSWLSPPRANQLGVDRRIGVNETVLPRLERWCGRETPLSQVIGELAMLTVDQHLQIAWSRLAQDTKRDVALLLTEGTAWKFRGEFRNGRTASRIRQATGWLQQLQLISDSGITSAGEQVLMQSQATLRLRQGAVDESA
jgi:hypothetical protein